ncbi:MAG: insulinase family protein, partial [Blastocatellia bacterium]|nr:insulinase family protein [Blastocatellia bacterium]
DVAALLKDYKGKAAVAAGEAFEPSPSNIEARTKRGEASGLKRAFLSKKTRGNTVVVRLSLRFGDEQSLMNRGVAGSFAGQMLMRGTTKHTREQLKEEMDKLKARAFVGGGATSAFVSIDTVRENLPAVMRLVAEVLKEPSFPTNEFEQLKQEELAQLEAQRSEPQFQAFTAISRHFNRYPKGHVRYAKTLEESIEDIKSVTLADAKKFYEDFYGIANGELTVVGDFDEAEIAKLTDELFNGWKSKNSFKRIPDEYKAVEAANLSIETPDKANAFFIARQPISMRDDDPDYPAMILANYMMGGGFLNSRLAVRIRQKEGLSYGVGSQFAADSLDKNANFLAFAIYAPENAGKLEAAFREEIEKVTKDGFTAEEVASAKNGYLQSRQVSRAQDGELAGRLGNYLYLGRTLQWDAEFEKKISELTAEQINAAVRKHIDVSKITIVKAGDFAKTAKK